MFCLREPGSDEILRFLQRQQNKPFSYPEVGATRSELPSGYAIDHNRIKLGEGEEVFNHAAAALRCWQQFDLGWVQIVPATTPIEVDAVVAIKARTIGIWTLSACRIVYVINEDALTKKLGFAYGTLTDHVERGEERFTIEVLRNGEVWYDILAFSRPQHPLVKLGRPYARILQKRFAEHSKHAMVDAVSGVAVPT